MLKKLTVLALAVLVHATPSQAACEGVDLFADLPAMEQAELRARAGAVPYPIGNLWHATDGNTVLHVVGTMHVPDRRMDAMMARLGPLVAAADMVFLEAAAKDRAALQAELAADPSRGFLTEGPTLPELLPEADWQRLMVEFRARNIAPVIGSRFRPWMVLGLLSMPACVIEALQAGEHGLDQRIENAAEAAGVPVRGLEPHDTIFGLFDELALGDQIVLLQATLLQGVGGEDLFATLSNAWSRGEHRLLWEFSLERARAQPGADPAQIDAQTAQLEELLLSGRNRGWMQVLRNEAVGRTAVVAVGAAHLSGHDGLLDLLDRAGFTLTRIDP